MKRLLLATVFVVAAFAAQAQIKGTYFYYAFRIEAEKCQITKVFSKSYSDIVSLRERMEATDELYDPAKPTVIIGPMTKEDAEEAQTRRRYALIGHFKKANVKLVDLNTIFIDK